MAFSKEEEHVSADNLPILVGAAQLIERESEPEKALDPLAMLEQIARAAAEDARGGDGLLRSLDTIGIVQVAAWNPQNAARLFGDRIGANASIWRNCCGPDAPSFHATKP